MPAVIPSDAHAVGDPGHTTDHNNASDVLALLTQAATVQGGNPPTASNAAMITAVQSMVTTWAGYNTSSYQFYPEVYGAKGDGKIVTDGAMSSTVSTTTLTCATSTPFAAGDVGKWVSVAQAGGSATTPLFAQITAVADSSHVTLSAACTFTCSSSIVIFGTDDTAAINSAVTAAYTAWLANPKLLATITFSQKIYCLGGTGSPVNSTAATGAGLGNALIPLPIIPTTGQKMTLVFQGVPDATGLLHWQELVPQTSGACIACLRADGTNDATYGPSSVIGGPYNGYGAHQAPGNLFTNMLVVVDGIEIMVPYNSTYGGFDFYAVAEANVVNAAVLSASILGAGPPFPSQSTPANLTHFWVHGLRMPCANNNDDSVVMVYAAMGIMYGFSPSEHTVALSIRAINCYYGILPYAGTNSGGMVHAMRIVYASCENCVYMVGPADSAPVNFDIETLDVEQIVNNLLIDTSNFGNGTIGFRGQNLSGYLNAANIANGGANVEVICLQNQPGVPASPPAAPASTVAQTNFWFRKALVWLAATTGITAVKVDSTTIGITGGNNVTIGPVFVPSGHTYTVTYTGVLTVTWVLM